MDIDGGGAVGPLERDPITGPVGVLVVLCGGGGGAVVVGLGADVGCGWLGVEDFELFGAEEDGRESLIAPPLGRSPSDEGCEPWSRGAPLGRSVLFGVPGPLEEPATFFVSCDGGRLAVLLQAAQTRAAATAVAAALASATVPRFGMDATVAK